jgi:outer membrane protein assembly factor BamC
MAFAQNGDAAHNPRSPAMPLTRIALAGLAATGLALSGCSAVSDAFSGDKVDYRTSGAQSVKLDVPPDLSQLPGQQRFGQIAPPSVSATSLMKPDNKPDAAVVGNTVAPTQLGDVKLVRDGQTRWLQTSLPAERVWDVLHRFWTDAGFELTVDNADAGVMETNWSENRAKVPQDGVRKVLGRVFDFLYDTGERDMYRTRIERTVNGTEIYITHRGLSEQYEDSKKERTTWVGRPRDPGLEAEMLGRLMARLGAPATAIASVKADKPEAAAPAASTSPTLAQLNADGLSLSVNVDFDVAWRRISLALDRSGFTVESRDRKSGIFEVRLSDTDVDAKKPGFFAKLFGATEGDGLSRYRVIVQGQGSKSLVTVLDDKGQITSSPTAKRIAKQLAEELG